MNIDTGIATFLPNANEPLVISEVGAGVKNSGFELLWLEIELFGTISEAASGAQNELSLRVDATGQVFLLLEGATDSEREAFAHSRELTGQLVSVRGRADRTSPGALVLLESSAE